MAENQKYTYKAKDGIDRFVPGFGTSKGGILVTTAKFENPNFELVENDKPATPPTEPSAPVSQPTAPSQPPVAPAAPVAAPQVNSEPLKTETKETI